MVHKIRKSAEIYFKCDIIIFTVDIETKNQEMIIAILGGFVV